MNRLLLTVTIAALVAGLGGCASSGGSGGTETAKTADAYPAGYSAPPPGSPLAGVQIGSNDTDVRKIMGEPDRSNAYMTGKAWIPYYYGSDTSRTDWMYSGQGRVVFSRNRYSGGLKVIKVLYNPNEP
jgi:hypothetical protein